MVSTKNYNVVGAKRERYKGYLILNRQFYRRNLDSIIDIIEGCGRDMSKPIMLHYVAQVVDDNTVGCAALGFVREFKRGFNRYIRAANKIRKNDRPRHKVPALQMFYSIEAKYINASDHSNGVPPWVHIHMMVIVDMGRYGFNEINHAINQSIFNTEGLTFKGFNPNDPLSRGALKLRNTSTSIKAQEHMQQLKYHELKNELDDAVCRASYLAKTDQKDLLPTQFKAQSFGRTRMRKHAQADG